MGRMRGTSKKDSGSEREAWLEKLQFLNNAMESTSQPFAAGSPEGSTLIFNEAFCHLTGHTREELYHLNWSTDLTTPESRIKEFKMLEVLDRTHEPQRYEKDYIRKDGTIIPVELLTHVALGSQGNILYYYSFITDISEHKRKEDELRKVRDEMENRVQERTAELAKSKENLRQIIEASPIPMVVFEESKNHLINKKFTEIFGYTMDDIPSVNEWWPHAYPDREYREFVKKRWYAAVDEAIKNKTSIAPQEVIVTCKDGSKKHILNYFSSIGDLGLSVFYDITEHKQAEESLRESEKNLLLAQRISHLGFWVWDVNRNDLEWSDEVYHIFKLIPQEFRPNYESFLSFIHPEDRELVRIAVQDALDGKNPYSVDWRILRRDGSMGYAHSQGEVLYENGKPVRMVGTMLDITERKRAEEALLQSEQRLRRLYESGLFGVMYWNMDGVITDANDKFLEMLGYTREDLIAGRIDWINMTPPEHRHLDEKSVIELKATGVNKMPFEKEYIRKDGTRIPIIFAGAMLDEAHFNGVAFVLDITDRKKVEEALRNSERLYRAIGELIDYGVWVCAPDGRNIYASESFLILVGQTQQQCSDFGWGDVLHPDDAERTIEAWKECVRTGGKWDIEHRYRGVDGKWHPILARGVPVRDEHGKIIYWAGINLDISGLKRTEEELKEAKMQAELYLDLMGHDISNMHQIIEAQLELAQEIMVEKGRLEGDEKELIDTPLQTLERSNMLIENVRKLQKLRAGQYKTETIDLGKLLAEVVEEHSRVPGKDVAIDYSTVQGHLVMANPLLKDVFRNLFSNAIKHSNGPIRIGVMVDRVNENGSPFYCVAIEDNGPGIPDPKKGEVFHRFMRGQTTARGTGLGLYIVKTLLESIHGKVKVEDRIPGDYTQGSRFLVYLPVLEDEHGK